MKSFEQIEQDMVMNVTEQLIKENRAMQNENSARLTRDNLAKFTSDLYESRECDRKHEANPPGKREEVYQKLAGYEHNELPIDKFISDYLLDDQERVYKLITNVLKREFSYYCPGVSDNGEELARIIGEAFDDYVSGEDYE